MKHRVIVFILIVFYSYCGFSQQNTDSDIMTHVASIDQTIDTYYDVLSEDKAVERNWKLFKFLFTKEAQLIPSTKNKDGVYVWRYMSPETYIKSSGRWMYEHGFIEKEINRKVEVFGPIAHVFSTYEAYHSKADTEPFMRGINSIQLLNDGERWWIVNVYWTLETEHNRIPAEYLPKH